MDGALALHITLVIIFCLAVLACRLYCRKRNKHKSLQFMIAQIHPLRVTPVLQPHLHYPHILHTMSVQTDGGPHEFLPGGTCPNSAQPSSVINNNEEEDGEDQVSLESHSLPHDSVSFAEEIKSPPPPYSAVFYGGFEGDLPSYEEAIRWSKPPDNSEA